MSGTVTELAYQPTSALMPPVPADFDWDHYYDTVVTEDDEPVDSLYAEELIRLLPDILYASWTPPVSPGQAPRDLSQTPCDPSR